jgi:hypothetical protein
LKLPACGFEQSRGADHVGLGFRGVAFGGRRHPAEQDGDVIEWPVGPGEFEEGVDEDQDQPDAFGFPQRGRRLQNRSNV